jgi:hypothetical protein
MSRFDYRAKKGLDNTYIYDSKEISEETDDVVSQHT